MASCLTTNIITIAATSAATNLPTNCCSLILKAPSSNAGTVYFNIDQSPASTAATGSSARLAAGDSMIIDISPSIQATFTRGDVPTQEVYMRFITTIGTANDILQVFALSWVD